MSVLTVTYQHARYVKEAINSALHQTVAPAEVVVADDGSADETVRQAKAIGDPRVRVLSLPHRGLAGLAATYSEGLAACSGELVALLEGDDRWPPDKLSWQIPDFKDEHVVLSHGRYSVIGAHGRLLHPGVAPSIRVPEGTYDALPYLLRASYVMAVTVVVRREALQTIGSFRLLRGTPHWDYPTFLRLAEEGQFHAHSRVLGDWRRHGRSVTHGLAGVDLAGIDLSRNLALETRTRLNDRRLPAPEEIVRGWDEAHAHMIWQAARILLLRGSHAEARRLLVPALRRLRRRTSRGIRARLFLALAASLIHMDLEQVARVLTGRSVFHELD